MVAASAAAGEGEGGWHGKRRGWGSLYSAYFVQVWDNGSTRDRLNSLLPGWVTIECCAAVCPG